MRRFCFGNFVFVQGVFDEVVFAIYDRATEQSVVRLFAEALQVELATYDR